MNKRTLAWGAIFVVIVGLIVFVQVIKPQLDDRTVSVVVQTSVSGPDGDLVFSYPSGEAGYALVEPPVPSTSGDLKKVFIIMNNQEYIDHQASDDLSTPPTVSIFVFERTPLPGDDDATSTRSSRLLAWAKNNPEFSSLRFATTEPEAVEVDGAKAFRYYTEGTYQQEVYIVSYLRNVYVFTGQYEHQGDDIRQMFIELMNSVTFG